LFLYAMGIAAAFLAALGPGDAVIPAAAAAAALLLSGMMFGRLTVCDEGAHLLVQVGPLPLFRKRIPYASMTAVDPCRSRVLDGWGIHWNPCEGWIYNLAGFDCVRIRLDGKAIRVGTDDVENLVAFLKEKARA
jgi:hypothetical protein